MDVPILLNGAKWSKKFVTSRSEDCFIKPDIKRQIFVIVFLFKCPSLALVKQSANRAKRSGSCCCIMRPHTDIYTSSYCSCFCQASRINCRGPHRSRRYIIIRMRLATHHSILLVYLSSMYPLTSELVMKGHCIERHARHMSAMTFDSETETLLASMHERYDILILRPAPADALIFCRSCYDSRSSLKINPNNSCPCKGMGEGGNPTRNATCICFKSGRVRV